MRSLRHVFEAHAFSGTEIKMYGGTLTVTGPNGTTHGESRLTYVASCECGTEFGKVEGDFDRAHHELRSRWSEHLIVEVASFIHDALLVSLDTVPS